MDNKQNSSQSVEAALKQYGDNPRALNDAIDALSKEQAG